MKLFELKDIINQAYEAATDIFGNCDYGKEREKLEEIFSNLDNDSKKDSELIIGAVAILSVHHNDPMLILSHVDKSLKKNKEFVLQILLMQYENKYVYWEKLVEFIDKSLLEDKDIFKAIVDKYRVYDDLPESIRKKSAIVRQAIVEDPNAIYYAPSSLKKNREIILEVLNRGGSATNLNIKDFVDDKEVMQEVCKDDPYFLVYNNSPFLHDRDFVLNVVKNNPRVLEYVDDDLKRDKEILSEAIKSDKYSFDFLPEDLKSNKKLILEIAKHYKYALCSEISDELRADKEIVLEAVKHNEDNLKYASDELKSDKEIVLEAVKHDHPENTLKLVDPIFLQDKDVILEAIKNNPDFLETLSSIGNSLCQNREFILELFESWEKEPNNLNNYAFRRILNFVPDELRTDKEVVLKAIKINALNMEYASEELRADKEVVSEAIKNNGSVLKYASEELQSNKELVLEAVKTSSSIPWFIPKELEADRNFMLKLIENGGSIFVNSKYVNDKEIAVGSVKNDVTTITNIDKKLWNDPEIITILFSKWLKNRNSFIGDNENVYLSMLNAIAENPSLVKLLTKSFLE